LLHRQRLHEELDGSLFAELWRYASTGRASGGLENVGHKVPRQLFPSLIHSFCEVRAARRFVVYSLKPQSFRGKPALQGQSVRRFVVIVVRAVLFRDKIVNLGSFLDESTIHQLQLTAVRIDDLTRIPESVAEDAFCADQAEELVDICWVVHTNREFNVPAMARTAIELAKIACGAAIAGQNQSL
jgi:hypothetical protein